MIYQLPHYGSISIEGIDAKTFLQGQLTCNLDTLKDNQSIMGAHCNPKGRIISLFYCLYHDNLYSLIMPLELIPIALSALKKYAPFFKVNCVNTSEQYQFEGYTQLKLASHTENKIIPINSSIAMIMKPKANENKTAINPEWNAQLITARVPIITANTSQTFLPHELNLETFNAISFDKGCYTGQEIIARMHYRSEIKFALHVANIETETTIAIGDDIYDSLKASARAIGRIVNLQKTSIKEYQLLITVKEPLSSQIVYLNHSQPTILAINTR